MQIVFYVGLDVHSTSHSIAMYNLVDDAFSYEYTVDGDPESIVKYVNAIAEANPNATFKFGYEAGCLGKSIYYCLTKAGYECVIMAPTTIAVSTQNRRKKNDRRDARSIAKALATKQYKAVYITDDKDDQVRDFIRARQDLKKQLKMVKQQISSFLMHNGYIYHGTKWTNKHFQWIQSLNLSNVQKLTFDLYMHSYRNLTNLIEEADEQISKFASDKRYEKNVLKLIGLKGIKELTAMTLISEIGDFNRFPTANAFASYLGLTPTESSSGEKIQRGSISKLGNSHCRMSLIESAQAMVKGARGYKSKALKSRQKGLSPDTIAYCDQCTNRLMKRFTRLTVHKRYNVAITAIARQLACFIWGIMTNHTDLRLKTAK